jgi:hypothetical protein
MARLGDPAAVERLISRFGVRYALLDEVNGYATDLKRLKKLGEVVYSAPGVKVLKFTTDR